MKVLGISGSLRQDSFNTELLRAAAGLLPPGVEFEEFTGLREVPPFDADTEHDPPAAVAALKDAIAAADAVLIATPEYNHSIPGVLKNALDHASRPYGDSAWAGKPAGVIGASVGATGTALAQQHLRNVLAYLNMPTLGQPEAFIQWSEDMIGEDGRASDKPAKYLSRWMAAFLGLVKRHAG